MILCLVSCEKDQSLVYDFHGDREAVNTDYQASIVEFSHDLLQAVYSEEENINISPLSIHMILSLLGQGGQGETKDQINQVLHIDAFDDQTIQNENRKLFKNTYIKEGDSELMIANSLWLREDYEFNEAYQAMAKDAYFAQVYNVDFTDSNSNDQINQWALDHTNQRIDLNFQGNEHTVSVLLNAIYLIDLWQMPFEEKLTANLDFTMNNGQVINIPTMRQYFEDYPYYEGQIFYKVAFDLERVGKVEIILPKDSYGVKDLLDESTFEETLTDQMTDTINIDVHLPKGKIEASYKLGEILKELGMVSAFNQPNFLNICPKNMKVTSVIHKTFFAFDEKKVEAAAVTEVATEDCAAEEVEELKFYVDKPFMYTIKSSDGTLLFIGVMNQPKED